MNLTDPDARLMRTRQGVRPAFNGQTAVDGKCQVILAARVVEKGTDSAELVPMIEETITNTGRRPWIVTADSGYSSLDNLEYLERNHILGLIPDVMYRVEKLGKTKYYPRSLFKYNATKDTYTCPRTRCYRIAAAPRIARINWRATGVKRESAKIARAGPNVLMASFAKLAGIRVTD